MSDFILGYSNVGDNCTFASSETWDTNLPITMLNNEYITAIARTGAGVATTTIDITIDSADISDIEVMGIINCNLTSGTYKWECYSDAARTAPNIVYDGASTAIPTFYENLNYKTIINVADQSYDEIYWRLIITETTESLISIGKIFLGKRYYQARNMDYGLQMGVVDGSTEVYEADSGVETYNVSKKKRTATFGLSLMDYIFGDSHFKMNIENGISGNMLFEFDPANFKGGIYSFICRMNTLNPLEFPHYNINNTKVNLVEII